MVQFARNGRVIHDPSTTSLRLPHETPETLAGSAGLWSTEERELVQILSDVVCLSSKIFQEALASVRRGDDELHRKTDAVQGAQSHPRSS